MVQTAEKHKKEYDEFGPWIWIVENDEEIPDLFLDHFTYDDTVQLAFKIPRNIERRTVRPGANLYDFLIVIYPESLHVLRQVDTRVERTTVSLDEITAIGRVTDLLHGELLLYLPEGAVMIPFNTVSDDIVDRAVELIRRRNRGDAAENMPSASESEYAEKMSMLFRNLLNQARERESIALLAHQRSISTTLRSTTWYARLVALFHRTLQESAFLSTPTELIVFQRIPQIVWSRKGHYGYMQTYIRRRAITSIESAQNPRVQGVDTLSIRTGTTEFACQVGHGFSVEALGNDHGA